MRMAKILVVDDASFMRGSLKYIIESAGHQVVGMAQDGNEAIAMYKKLKPDIVTLDILMKGMDGMTALKRLRELDPKAKVIMVTAVGMDDKKEEASKLGALGYIRKPFKQAEIVAEIAKVMSQK
jgi:two-component system chemotaxis response regulator CheY